MQESTASQEASAAATPGVTMQSIARLFRINAPESAVIPVRDRDPSLPAGAYPRIIEHYVFQTALLKKMLYLLTTRGSRSNMMLFGDTGTGKSSLVEQVAARLGIPVFAIACSGKMRVAHFLGTYMLRNGNTEWVDGPLLMAARHGGIFLADEITRLDHSEQMALAHMLDSGTVTVPDTGEIVVATDAFRFIGTGNSAGYGDESGAYNGEKVASAAFLDRFQKLKVDYLAPDDEAALLTRIAGQLGEDIIKKMVQFANQARHAFVSRGGDLRVVLSTRNVVVWALESVRYGRDSISPSPIEEALYDTVLNGAPDGDVRTLTELWQTWINA